MGERGGKARRMSSGKVVRRVGPPSFPGQHEPIGAGRVTLSMPERKRIRRAMDEQPAEHRSVRAIPMSTEVGRTGPLTKRNARADALYACTGERTATLSSVV